MLTEYEAQKLTRDYMKRELNAAPGVALKCAVLLLLIIGLAWIGAASEGPAGRDSRYSATPAMAQPELYSKTVFEERRRRYIEAYPDSRVAREAAAQRQRDANSDEGYFAYQSE